MDMMLSQSIKSFYAILAFYDGIKPALTTFSVFFNHVFVIFEKDLFLTFKRKIGTLLTVNDQIDGQVPFLFSLKGV